MDDFVKNKFQNNVKIYTDNLERIVQKYSKLHDDGTEVNLEDITPKDVSRCMFKSELELLKLELSKSDAGLAELSLGDISEIHRPHDTTGDFKMDISYHQDDANNDCVDEGAVDTSAVTAPSNDSVMQQAAENSHWVDNSKVNETRSNLWGAPEEQDGELERSLSSQRSTLQELYPSMLSQIGEAWRRQHMSDAAVGVLRRYHRLRWSSNRNLNNRTFNSTLRPAHRKPDLNNSHSILLTSQNTTLNVSNPKSPKFNLKRTNGTYPPSQTKVNLQKWPAERQSPRKRTDSGNRQPSRPFPLMDFSSCPSSAGSSPAASAPSSPPSAPSSPPSALSSPASSTPSADSSLQDSPELDEAPLNQTFTVSMSSAPLTRVRYTTLVFSPDRSEGPSTAGGLSSPSLRCAPPTVPSQRICTAVRPVVSMGMSSDTERSAYRSSSAQSPYRARLLSWEGQRASPNTGHRSLKSGIAGYHQRNMVTVEPRSSPAFSPSFQRPLMSPRKLHHLDACSTSQLKVHSSRFPHQESTARAAQPKLQRHYSLDSFSPSISLRNSTKQIDKDFQKLYHKLVCQGKPVPSCRMCERRAETTRGPSSSALAALALSPYHSVMRKRRRELVQEHSPESKRFRDNSCLYSPGSLRQIEMIRCQNRSDSHLSSTHLSSIQRYISCDSHAWSPHRASLFQIRHSPHHQHHSDAAVRKAAGSWSGLHVDQPSPACRAKYNRFVGIHQGTSPVKAECQCGCSPSFSRRRLLYK
ncbi:uncharacterized protein si:dkeyp-117h8.4 [Salvelinus fontinalis]|uniref:uncharacterized protein si:dkeyp-117h8.4 n=1 Tax=Salvelinus fontinalis TaxID=8038 RepID=UPI0024866E24|nr:uncharacterized protein si:dkeyp-117h8.4 [Salvelinus fontinalis]